MAEQKKGFPMLPIAHWWALRKKFKQSIPGVVTDNYLSTVLSMEVNSARANVMPFLKTLGIIDDEGKTLERAKKWRDDQPYTAVCKEILHEVYPKDLLEAVPNPNTERAQAERWFANHTGAGENAVKRMAALYAVLVEADASKQPDQEKAKTGKADKEPPKSRSLVHTIGKLAEPSRYRLKHGRGIADRDVISLHCGVEHSLNRIHGEPDLGEFPQFIARKQNTVVSHRSSPRWNSLSNSR
jgi:hypothetical protein